MLYLAVKVQSAFSLKDTTLICDNETRGKIHFWWTLIAFNVTFFPMHFLGLAGMPRRYADYPMQFTDFNMIASVGAFFFGFAQVYFFSLS